MTHPIYSETFLQSLPLPRLKEIAKQLGTKPVVDARFKKTWVLVILRKQQRTVELVENLVELLAIDPQPIEPIQPIEELAIHPIELPTDKPIEELAIHTIELPTDKPIEELAIHPIELPIDKPIEESQLVEPTPILITVLAVAIVLLCSIAIVPALIIGSIAISLGQPNRGIPPCLAQHAK
jgi:hypothetical protein